VGHTTLSSGHGPLKVGDEPVRTGVTAVLPRGKSYNPVFAGWYALNGDGEMTGINGNTIHALPHQRLTEALRKYNRLVE
jgi:L-aminopeptidase/D-esterase-like protein